MDALGFQCNALGSHYINGWPNQWTSIKFFGMSTIKSCVVFTSVEKACDFSRHFSADKKSAKKNCDQTNGHQLNLLGCLQ
jgi:hypothetical protein